MMNTAIYSIWKPNNGGKWGFVINSYIQVPDDPFVRGLCCENGDAQQKSNVT